MTLEQWNTVLSINLTGQFLCAREAVREFKRRGVVPEVSCAAGKIICISSVHEVIPWAGHVNYAASKGGVMLMMKSIAQEVAPYRIRVNSIAPGAIRTPINTAAWQTPEAYEALMTLVPYKRIGETDDIGQAAVWLASDAADYVTGISLYIDGGMTLYPGFATGGCSRHGMKWRMVSLTYKTSRGMYEYQRTDADCHSWGRVRRHLYGHAPGKTTGS
jgi:glucose 1-dehydrogenase